MVVGFDAAKVRFACPMDICDLSVHAMRRRTGLMRWNMLVLISGLLTAGCVGNSTSERQDENMKSSLLYDAVPCEKLLAQRDGLAQQYNLSTQVKPTFSNPAMGFGPFTPDMRSQSQRDIDRATGEIDAMNRSIDRRDCGKPEKQEKPAQPG
jgi:hypothetical protein